MARPENPPARLAARQLELSVGLLVSTRSRLATVRDPNKLGRAVYTKLKVYAGAEHPHSAQQPLPVTNIV